MPPKKAIAAQYEELLNLIKKSDAIRWGKGTPDMKREAWEQISQVLTSIGGAQKNGEGWKNTLIEWKLHIKAKIRCNKSLTDTEKECAEAMGLMVASTGISNVPELGLEQKKFEYYGVDSEGNLFPDVPGSFRSSQIHDLDPEAEEALETEAELHVDLECEDRDKKKKSKKGLTGHSKSVRLLLDEHIQSTHNGLQDIAKSIMVVADSINNLAAAVRESEI